MVGGDFLVVCLSQLIGRTFLPPYWSLGFQLCRWGYNSLTKVKQVVDRMRKYDIPQVGHAGGVCCQPICPDAS